MKNDYRNDKHYMQMAIRLASKGVGFVNPNPRVGAVIVCDGVVVGTGFHEYFGGPHAEVNALTMAGEAARGATLFVTLEPCNHRGKTPPCAPAVAEAGIRRVVVGITDPNPAVQGGGAVFLREQGVEVVTGLLEGKIREQNAFFLKHCATGKPFGILKSAMTLDGKIATVSGESRWISSTASRRFVHRMRREVAAILTGVNTVLTDNPMLDVRLPGKKYKNPLKVIVDSEGRLPPDANVMKHEPQLTIVAVTGKADIYRRREYERLGAQVLICPDRHGKVDLTYLAGALGTMGIDSILVEAGGTLAFSALESGIIDRVAFFVAPKIVGGEKAPTAIGGKGIYGLAEAYQLKGMRWKKSGDDLMIEANL